MLRIANAPCSWGALEFDLDTATPDYAQSLLRESSHCWEPSCRSHLPSPTPTQGALCDGALMKVVIRHDV